MAAKCHECKHSALFILLYGLFIANTAQASYTDNRYNQLGEKQRKLSNFFSLLQCYDVVCVYVYFTFPFRSDTVVASFTAPYWFASRSSSFSSSSPLKLFTFILELYVSFSPPFSFYFFFTFSWAYVCNASLHFSHYFPSSLSFPFVYASFHNYGFEVMKLEID